MKIASKLFWILFVALAIIIGLYPLIYYLVDMHDKGLMTSKTKEVLASNVWHTIFYIHISFGGIALLLGWSQFSKKIRAGFLKTHRMIGKIYVIAVIISSLAGLYIALFASGGIVSQAGFSFLAIFWFATVLKAYTSILKKNIDQHEKWMIRNYALTFAAVTLRIYLPLLSNFIFHDFVPAYRMVSWLCWVPNLIVAEMIINKKKRIENNSFAALV